MQNQLEKFGFSQRETSIYLALLELGISSPASTIAKKAKINRTTAYDILNSLSEKGIIISNQNKTGKFYEALPPNKLVAYLKEQSRKYQLMALEAEEELLPQLIAKYNQSVKRPKVYFYEGIDGLIRVYEETLTSSEEILAYASEGVNQTTIPTYFPKYYQRRAAKNIPIRALFTDTASDRIRHSKDAQELRVSRLLPKNIFNFTPEVNLFDNKMMIADWKNKFGIIIESEEITKVFKQTFELAWEAAEKYHKKRAPKAK